MMRILGIDPGIAITGWGVVDVQKEKSNGLVCVEYGVIETPSTDDHADRLVELRRDLEQILSQFSPDYAAVEKLFFSKNVKTATVVGEARGVVLVTIAELSIPLYEFTPPQVKDAVCGYGKAPKRQVQEMVQSILNLPELPSPDDAADALAVAISCASGIELREKIA